MAFFRRRWAWTPAWAIGLAGALSLLMLLAPAVAQDDPGPGAVIIVESEGDTRVTEGGPPDTYTAVLGDAPTSDVVVVLSADAALLVEPAALTFSPGDWSTTAPVSVSAVDDDVDDGDRSVAIGHHVTSSDPRYDGIVVNDVLVALADDDKAGVVVEPASLALTEGDQPVLYRLRLASRPSTTVTVTAVADPDDVVVDPATVVFPPGEWNKWQTVSVAVTNDDLARGTRAGTIDHTVASDDAKYDGLAIDDVALTLSDDDAAGVTVSPLAVQVTEGGATADYQVSLRSAPSAAVDIHITTDGETAVSPAHLTFGPTTWEQPRVVTVMAVDDGAQEGTHLGTIDHSAQSADPMYDEIGIPSVTATITDGRQPGVIIVESGGSTFVTEGGATDSYTVALAAAPTDSVVVGIAPNSQVSVVPSALTFDASDWAEPQTIVVRAVDDNVAEGSHAGAITHSARSDDPGYDHITIAGVSVGITDNDVAGVQVAPTTVTAPEGGAPAGYDVALMSEPTADVTIRIAPDAQTVTTPTTLLFSPSGWDESRHVTVTANEDGVDEGDHEGLIRHSAESSDPTYDGIAVPTVTAVIADVRNPGVRVKESGGATGVTEGGQGDSYAIELEDAPRWLVTVRVVADPGITVSPSVLTFAPWNWRDDQTITVAAVDDARAEGNHQAIIRHTCESIDDDYDGIDVPNVNVSITDNDRAQVTVSPEALELVEGGDQSSYRIALTSRPTSDVTVRVETDGVATVDPKMVRFAPDQWQETRTVRVGAPDDAVAQGTRTGRVTHRAESADAMYDGLDVSGVTITVHDDERASLVVSTSDTEITEAGGDARLTLRLSSRPSDDVVVPVSSSSAMCRVAPAPVRLTPDTWDAGVQVIVSAEMEPSWHGEETCLIAIGPTNCDDDAYDGLDSEDVAITVRVAPTITWLQLPSLLRGWPPLPGTPALNGIDNPDGRGEYTVAWEAGERAESYVLQEARDASFQSAQEVYAGPDLSLGVTGRGAGRYFYRVAATNAWGQSAWSGVGQVDVLWEAEPNDDALSQANGPILPDLPYRGALADAADLQDYYEFELASEGRIVVSLDDIPGGQNYDLVVRDASLDLTGYSAELGNAAEHIATEVLPAGRYYLQVYQREGGGDARAYLLRYTVSR